MARHDIDDCGRIGPVGIKHRCAAEREWRKQAVLDAVGEKKFRAGKHAFARADANGTQRQSGTVDRAVRVHDALRPPSRAGGVQDKRRRLGRDFEGGGFMRLAQAFAPGRQKREAPFALKLPRERWPRRDEALVDDRKARRAVGEDVSAVLFRKPVVERHRDRTGVNRPEPGGGEVGRIAHEEHDALFGLHAKTCKRACGTAHSGGELSVGEALLAAEERQAAAVSCKR